MNYVTEHQAAEIERLRAENAPLRDAALGVLGAFDAFEDNGYSVLALPVVNAAIKKLRNALEAKTPQESSTRPVEEGKS